MNTTTNYEFKTYESGDLFNPLTVENANMAALDTDLKAVSDRAIGRATELVSGGVHAITLLDTDCKTFKFTATGNYTALETFTLNGISINAYMPDGSALGTDAYKTGAVVIASRNSDDSALTFYLSNSGGIAPDSEKLGGELPAYYATKDYADGIKSTADSASALIQKKALVNTYYDTSTHKLYVVNSDGTRGAEISMSKELDFANKVSITTTAYSTTKGGALIGSINQGKSVLINNDAVVTSMNQTGGGLTFCIHGIGSGEAIKLSASIDTSCNVYFVPYK